MRIRITDGRNNILNLNDADVAVDLMIRKISMSILHEPTEWMKFYNAQTGRYHFRHKGSGVVRDTLISKQLISKQLKKAAAQALKKATKQGAQKAVKKGAQALTEKGRLPLPERAPTAGHLGRDGQTQPNFGKPAIKFFG